LLRGARVEIAALAGSLDVAHGTYPEPAILRAVLDIPAHCASPAGRAVALGYPTTTLRAAVILRAAWTAAREDARDLAQLPAARVQNWLLASAWRRWMGVRARPAQSAHAVSATITSIIDGVPGGSAAHVARLAPPAPAPAAGASSTAAGSSSAHAVLPAAATGITGEAAAIPRPAGERAFLRPGPTPRGRTTAHAQATTGARVAVAISPDAAWRAFLRLGGWGSELQAAEAVAAEEIRRAAEEGRAKKRKRAEEVSALSLGMEQ
jgi:hypothetical protein